MTWQDNAIAATRDTQLGAILRCALGRNLPDHRAPRQFHGKATLTSDGFLMCDFTDAEGRWRMGAFVGPVSDLYRNIERLAKHLSLDDHDHDALKAAIADWIGTEWSK